MTFPISSECHPFFGFPGEITRKRQVRDLYVSRVFWGAWFNFNPNILRLLFNSICVKGSRCDKWWTSKGSRAILCIITRLLCRHWVKRIAVTEATQRFIYMKSYSVQGTVGRRRTSSLFCLITSRIMPITREFTISQSTTFSKYYSWLGFVLF